MSSTWRIGGEIVRCRSVQLGLAQTDTAEAEIIAESSSITDGAWVWVTCDSQPVMYGRAFVSPSLEGAANRLSVEVRGPWELFDAVVYQQGTKVTVPHAVDEDHPYGYALSSVLTPEVTLGMDDDGEARTTLQEAQAIADYAIDAIGVGVALDFAADFDGMAMQPTDISGSSCAACLLTVLRFHPDVLLYFDYSSGSEAVLTAKKATGVTPTLYPGAGRIITDADFKQRTNYKPAGIRILYTRTSVDGRIEAHTDTAGTVTGQGKAPNVINWPVNLEGAAPPPLLSQRIRTRPIPHSDNPLDPEEDETELKTNWWQCRLDWLNLPGVAEIVTIDKHRVKVDPPNITASEDPAEEIPEDWSLDPEDYPRELIDGTIPPWLTSKHSAPLTIKARFTLGDMSGLDSDVRDELREIFGGRLSLTRTAQVTGTDANTREYAALASWPDPPEWPAGGIANAYYTAFASAAWAGSMTLTGDTQPRVAMGGRVNVTGYHTPWASMGAVIRSISYSPGSHSVTVSCDPPDNFGFGDFFELQRTIRKAAAANARAAADRKARAIPSSGGNIRGAGATANRSVHSDDPGGDGTGILVPWACDRVEPFKIRVWPASIWDGAGNEIWPLVAGVPAVAEQHYDADVEEDAGAGYMYLECSVDDSNDIHGVLTAATLKLDFDTHTFFAKAAGKVLIPICSVNSGEEGFTFTPLRSYVFVLRRYGPPGSTAWDVTPL